MMHLVGLTISIILYIDKVVDVDENGAAQRKRPKNARKELYNLEFDCHQYPILPTYTTDMKVVGHELRDILHAYITYVYRKSAVFYVYKVVY